MPKKFKQKDALARFHETHGDRYDYSRVECSRKHQSHPAASGTNLAARDHGGRRSQ